MYVITGGVYSIMNEQTPQGGNPPTPQPKAPAAGQQYSADYKTRMGQLKDANKQRVQDLKVKALEEIDGGAGDEIADGIRDFLRKIFMAPYDVLNYAIITLMSLSQKDRSKFILIGIVVSAVCAAIFLALYFLTGRVNYLIDIGGCAIAMLCLYFAQSLSLTTTINLDELEVPSGEMYL